MGKNQEVVLKKHNDITAGTEIKGEIKAEGDFRFDGILIGNLNVNGRLVVGTTGKIEGDIRCKNALIEGRIDGRIYVEDLLSLNATAKITGDVITNKLSIEVGAIFTGTCKMNSENKNSTSTPIGTKA